MIRQHATPADAGPDGLRMRLIGTPAQVQLAVIRLRQAFTGVDDVSPELPAGHGQVRVYLTVAF